MDDDALLHLHLHNDRYYDLIETMYEDPNQLDSRDYSLLHIAAGSLVDNSRIVRLLIEKGAHLDLKTPKGHTPLHFATCSRNRKALFELIKVRADINYQDLMGRTALHFSVCKRWSNPPSPLLNMDFDMGVVKILLCHPGIILNPVDMSGETPLMLAVKEHHSCAVLELLKNGANPNISNVDNQTPLHVALSDRAPCVHIISSLFEYGAGIYCKDKFHQTPVDILVWNHCKLCFDSTREFATYCVWIIALRYQTRESLKQKLRSIPELYNYLNECCKEVKLMRTVIIYGKYTIHDFAQNCISVQVDVDPVRGIYIPVVEFLLSGLCRKYFKYVFSRLKLPDLRSVLQITAGDWFELDTELPNASNFAIFDAIQKFYDETVLLKRRLSRLKENLSIII